MSRQIDFADGFTSETVTTGGVVAASDVVVLPTGNLGSTNAQAALQELQGDIVDHWQSNNPEYQNRLLLR